MSTTAAAVAASNRRRADQAKRENQATPRRPQSLTRSFTRNLRGFRGSVEPSPQPASTPGPRVQVPEDEEDTEGHPFSVPSGAVTSLPDTVVVVKAAADAIKSSTGVTWLDRLKVWWVIDPRTTRWLAGWDITTMVALLFVAVVTPFEVAFLSAPRNAADIGERMLEVGWLFIVNRVVDVIFTVDLFLQFRLMYTSSNAIEGTRWHEDPIDIFRHYFFGWFALDFLSIAVCVFDIIPVVTSNGEDLRDLRVLRVMRVLRLIKLVRLLRASRLFQRWETKVAINYGRLSLVKSLVNVVLLSHWFACIWGLQVALKESREGTWVDSFEYCVVSNSTESADGYECPGGAVSLYSASIYWAVMTITSIVRAHTNH